MHRYWSPEVVAKSPTEFSGFSLYSAHTTSHMTLRCEYFLIVSCWLYTCYIYSHTTQDTLNTGRRVSHLSKDFDCRARYSSGSYLHATSFLDGTSVEVREESEDICCKASATMKVPSNLRQMLSRSPAPPDANPRTIPSSPTVASEYSNSSSSNVSSYGSSSESRPSVESTRKRSSTFGRVFRSKTPTEKQLQRELKHADWRPPHRLKYPGKPNPETVGTLRSFDWAQASSWRPDSAVVDDEEEGLSPMQTRLTEDFNGLTLRMSV